ncbi:hypothetical protein [Leptolyngbya sp. FACHB-261]|uniref:hypothetical protein n=1 Tax=Leptolyngbya sp. FACHB-261 TaxID=2692806 RepID=UPI001682A6BA|nr:hypothetical protein [Leptolyngbya sp. FACHB-261]MBD2102288.1 hypothetical protein [Leptolyngbya sp. FACHB-261]
MASKSSITDKLQQYRKLQEQLQQLESEINIPNEYREGNKVEEGIQLQSVIDGLEDLGLSPHQLADYMAAKKIVPRGYNLVDPSGKASGRGVGRKKGGNRFSRLTSERKAWLESAVADNPKMTDTDFLEMMNAQFSGDFSLEVISKLVEEYRRG